MEMEANNNPLNTANTAILIAHLKQGNETAFTSLYDRYSKQLYRNILRLVKDEGIAEELLQDLFLIIWEKRTTVDADKSFKSFLYKVAENLVYTHYRKIAKNKRLTAQLIATAIEFDTNAEERTILKEDQELLRKAIDSLSPQRKLVYTRCKFEGKSYQEVSDELGISGSTVSDHIVKANKAVRQYLLTNSDLALVVVVAAIFTALDK